LLRCWALCKSGRWVIVLLKERFSQSSWPSWAQKGAGSHSHFLQACAAEAEPKPGCF
jgi:hypothetical protein